MGIKIMESLKASHQKDPNPPYNKPANDSTCYPTTPYYQSQLNLDKPKYDECFLNDASYTPANNIKVTMPRFDGTDVEGWNIQVQRYFIYNKIPDEKKLLIASFHMDGIARKWFAWMEASNLFSDWKRFFGC